jgi:hypothetical protein
MMHGIPIGIIRNGDIRQRRRGNVTSRSVTPLTTATATATRPVRGKEFNKTKDRNELCEWISKSNIGKSKVIKVGKVRREDLYRLADELMTTNLGLILEHVSSGAGRSRILTVRIASKLFFTTAFMPTTSAATATATATPAATAKPKLEPWRSSSAKEHLEGLLRDRSSWAHVVFDTDAAHGNNINNTIKSIHVDEPLFTQYPIIT